MDIAFTINSLGLEGLGATLTSLIRSCSNPNEIAMWFFCSDLNILNKKSIQLLLRNENFNGPIHFIDFDAEKEFGHLKSLHGDWTSYGRLLIPDYIESEVVLYLDADLIVLVDVLELKTFDFANNNLAAATGGKVKYCLERGFLMNQLNIPGDTDYFNAGVLLLNLKQWRIDEIQNKWKQIAQRYPNDLLAVDQTLLNAISKGKFAHLPFYFNNAWCPGDPMPTDADNSILHFVGSPKPWDTFGKMLHSGYGTWKIYNTKTWHNSYNGLTWGKVVRTWKIKNSILIKMRKKISNRTKQTLKSF